MVAAGSRRADGSQGASGDPLDAIDWGAKLEAARIDVYFAPRGAIVDGIESRGWTAYEIRRAWAALDRIADVVDLAFRETRWQAGAEFRLTTGRVDGDLGLMYPPGERSAGLAVFDPTEAWPGSPPRDGGLEPGSFGFMVLLHEFGHGLGLAHPHDAGGRSTIWPGVRNAFDDFGRAQINQGVHTVMSYNDGWPAGPSGQPTDDRYGFEASMMALDVAVLQAKYGANSGHATGDDVYLLPDVNAIGTSYTCIWDAGGFDTIAAAGGRGCVIDLRAASLLGEPGGGGWISHASGVRGGVTIANGVRIEAARGGSGDDLLRGNDAANRLTGGRGDDMLVGGDGADLLRGGAGADELRGRAGADLLAGGAGGDWLRGGGGADVFQFRNGDGRDVIFDFQDGVDRIRILSGANRFSDLALGETDGAVVLRFADVTVTLEDTPRAAFAEEDFLFA